MQDKLYLCLIKHPAINMHGGMEILLHAFLASARDRRFTPLRERAPGCSFHLVGLDAVQKDAPTASSLEGRVTLL
jgi:hypothetical protein